MSGTQHEHGAVMGIICNHALRRDRPVKLVCHAPDGSWDFICGEDDDEHDGADNLSAICAHCGFDTYVSGLSMEDLPVGWQAERPDAKSVWSTRRLTPEELAEYEE